MEMCSTKRLLIGFIACSVLFRPCLMQCSTDMGCVPSQLSGFIGVLSEIRCNVVNGTCECGGPCFELDSASTDSCSLRAGCWRTVPEGGNSRRYICVSSDRTFFELVSNILFAISAIFFVIPFLVTIILIIPLLRYQQHGIKSKSTKYTTRCLYGSYVVCWIGTAALIIAGLILRAIELRQAYCNVE